MGYERLPAEVVGIADAQDVGPHRRQLLAADVVGGVEGHMLVTVRLIPKGTATLAMAAGGKGYG